ncbi:MAG: DAK2 domain-containing protein [Bacilli bacterium]|nr:DAK2 domain-containing protein [Bacilli bacterium]
MKVIKSETLKMMLLSGANHLYNHYPEVDALNVFPVPDGDTGMNMNLTMQSGAKEIVNRNDQDCYTLVKVFARGTFMGARGNSGVITSQIFKGMSEGLENRETIDAIALSNAMVRAKEVAYKVVVKPVEGTILTVIREASEALKNKVSKDMKVEEAFKILLEEAKLSLERTPNLLPILREVGVVDSGGAGLVKILEGMYSALIGEFIDKNESSAIEPVATLSEQASEGEDVEFGYCTEFIMRLGPVDNKKAFQENRFLSVLKSHGNSLVFVKDEDVVKVHIHTLNPGNILSYAQSFGEFIKIKVENMTEQHHELILTNENKSENEKSAASKLNDAPLKADKTVAPEKEYALIATSVGDGINEFFKELGVDEIVSGGQTMNPSTNDFLEKIALVNAKNVYIFPNNGNIIMAANQARDALKGKVNVVVIPTKTIPQGLVCAMSFNPELSAKENEENLNEVIGTVKSGAVTFAIKDTEIDGVSIKKDEYMAIKESKTILSSKKDKIEALKEVIDNLVDEDSSILTLLVGEDVTEEELKKVNELVENYSEIETDIRIGNQNVYSFLIGVE